jgi:very-short-patch-repair endonuclease
VDLSNSFVDDLPCDRPFLLTGWKPNRQDREAVHRAVLEGRLRCLLRGVYIAPTVVLTEQIRCAAVALVLPRGAAIARRTAAWLHGIDARMPGEHHDPVLMECVVPRHVVPVRRPGLRCYATPLAENDLELRGEIRCTTPLRTALDLLRWLPPHMALGAADAFAHQGLVTAEQLLRATERFPGDRGIAQARRLAACVEPLTESFGESWLRLRLLDAGFPVPTAQVPIADDSGRVIYRLDLGWPDRRLGLEYDGAQFHSTEAQLLHDRVRRERLARHHGWSVIGLSMGDVLGSSMHLEYGVGELLGMGPTVSRRRW